MAQALRLSSVLTFAIGVIFFNIIFDWVAFLQETTLWSDYKASLLPPNDHPQTPPNIVYGHIHMAKTAGTTLNGHLASLYNRVCGHKGYSLDFHRVMSRPLLGEDLESINNTRYSRARVRPKLMDYIGFEDCDYISHEVPWEWWGNLQHYKFSPWNISLELHVPCRDPLEHLMSQCNYRGLIFDCESDIAQEVSRCLVYLQMRFSLKLLDTFPHSMKCFQADKVKLYMDFIKSKLHERRIPFDFKHRSTNKPRDKNRECIWTDESARKKALDHLMKLDYYIYCSQCLNSKDDLLLQ